MPHERSSKRIIFAKSYTRVEQRDRRDERRGKREKWGNVHKEEPRWTLKEPINSFLVRQLVFGNCEGGGKPTTNRRGRRKRIFGGNPTLERGYGNTLLQGFKGTLAEKTSEGERR